VDDDHPLHGFTTSGELVRCIEDLHAAARDAAPAAEPS